MAGKLNVGQTETCGISSRLFNVCVADVVSEVYTRAWKGIEDE